MIFAKKAISILLGITILFTMFGCSTSGANAVVAKVDDVEIYRWEVDYLFNKNRGYYESQSKINLDDNANIQERKRYREMLLDDLVKDTAVVIAAKKMGYDLTEEESKQVDAEYDQFVEDNIKVYMERDFKDEPDARTKAEKKWKDSLKENNLTEAILRENMKNQKIQGKLTTELYKNLEANEDELKESYYTLIAEQKKKYEEDLDAYTDDASIPNDQVIYNPDGFYRVKHILIAMPASIEQQINEASKEQGPLIVEMSQKAVQKGEDDQEVKDLNKKIDDLNKKIAELREKGLAEIKDKADKINDRIKSGEDYDKVLEEVGEDQNMRIYPFNELGFLVCDRSMLDQSFVKGAMALENVGDISDLVSSVNGYHIIKLVDKVQEGAKPFEEVRDFLVELQMGPQRYKIIDEFAVEAKQKVNIESFPNRL